MSLALLFSLPALIYFSLPRSVPLLLEHIVRGSGGTLKNCEVDKTSMNSFAIADCELSFAATKASLRLKNALVTFDALTPTLSIEALDVVLPEQSTSPDGAKDIRVPAMPFSKLSIKKLNWRFAKSESVSLQTIELVKENENLLFRFLLPIYQLPKPAKVALENLAVSGTLSENILIFSGKSPRAALPELQLAGSYSFLEQKGELKLKQVRQEFSESTPLSASVELPVGFDVTGGTLEASLHLLIENARLSSASTVRISGDSLLVHFKDSEMEQLKFELALDAFPYLKTVRPGPFHIEKLKMGAVFLDTSGLVSVKDLGASTSTFKVENFRSSFIKGRLLSPVIIFSPNAGSNFTIAAEELDLQELLQLSGEKVRGSGHLSGQFPIHLSENRELSLRGGELHSQAPGGTLEYHSEAPEPENSNLALAMKALEQFHFDTLNAKLDYEPKGTLTADIALQGKNPHLFNGRKINFNVSIEENIPALIKSIRLATEAGKDVWSTNAK